MVLATQPSRSPSEAGLSCCTRLLQPAKSIQQARRYAMVAIRLKLAVPLPQVVEMAPSPTNGKLTDWIYLALTILPMIRQQASSALPSTLVMQKTVPATQHSFSTRRSADLCCTRLLQPAKSIQQARRYAMVAIRLKLAVPLPQVVEMAPSPTNGKQTDRIYLALTILPMIHQQ